MIHPRPRRKAPAPSRARSEINVTPLIDIVLVLLIVFIVMVPGLSKALPVVVPQILKTDAPPPDPRNPPLVLAIAPSPDRKGYDYTLQGEGIELQEIARRLCPVLQLQGAGQRKVFLRVDEEAPYQVVVRVLDQVRLASENAKRESAAKPQWGGFDGGDTRVAVSLRKRN